MKVIFLGPETSFSHDAALKAFPKAELVEAGSIQNVFRAVNRNEADSGIVPIENSTEGSVNRTLDLLVTHGLIISREIFIDIKHCFLSNSKQDEIKKIYSHPQAFAQCQEWLQKNYPDTELVGASSTASAAQHATAEKGSAAIASKKTAKKFGLNVLEENIQDLSFNKTRFIVIGKVKATPSPSNKTSMFFAVKDRPGALLDCLKGFKKNEINLTKLESRPSRKSAWEYVFFVEFEGDLSEKRVKKAIAELGEYAKIIKTFGSYPKKGD